MSFSSPAIGALLPGAPVSVAQPGQAASQMSALQAPSPDGDDFHSMVENGLQANSSGGVMEMLKGVDGSRKAAESAMVKVVATGDPSRMYDATAAMARFNLQTLVLNKMASKIGQAVDRLTNLQ